MDSSSSIRRDTYSWYKTNRNALMSEEHMLIKAEVKEWRRAAVLRYGDQVRAIEGLEADDLIGMYASPGDTVVTQDKDALQLPGVNLVDLNDTVWTIDRVRKYCKQPGLAQGEAFLAWQLCVGDTTDTIPRLLHTKDRTTIKTILKTEHPLKTLLEMVDLSKAIDHLNCLLTPTPLHLPLGEGAISLVEKRYGFVLV
jgi:5'-3' exonuclease